MANGRCRLHGGASLKGLAAPGYRHGKRSKYLPTGLRAHYEAALNDSELTTMRDDLALLDARIGFLLERLGTGESQTRWSEARAAYGDLKAATGSKNVPAMLAALESLGGLLEQGTGDERDWSELLNTIERKRRVAATEVKRIVMKHHVLTEERAYELLRWVLTTVKTHVTDRTVLAAMALDFERVLAGGPPTRSV